MTIPTEHTVSIWTRVGSRRGQPISSLGGTSAYPSILRSQHDRSLLPSPARVEVNSSRSAVSAVAAARGQCSPAWLSSRASRPLKLSLGFVPHIVPTPSRRRSRRSGCGGSLSGLSPIRRSVCTRARVIFPHTGPARRPAADYRFVFIPTASRATVRSPRAALTPSCSRQVRLSGRGARRRRASRTPPRTPACPSSKTRRSGVGALGTLRPGFATTAS
jgi:hypothetical protein